MKIPLFNPDGGPAPAGGLPNLTRLPSVAIPQPAVFGGDFVVGGDHRHTRGTVMVLTPNTPVATPGGYIVGPNVGAPAWPLL